MMRLKAIIFDWAGTVVDFGSLCPVGALQRAFAEKSINVAPKDINRFMGIHKREHVRAILSLPGSTEQWQLAYGRKPAPDDVDELHALAEQIMFQSMEQFATPTPHLHKTVKSLRKDGLKIGSSTGYTARLMEKLVPAAKRQGYTPDFWVASDQVPKGRPWPWMIFRNMESLGVCPPAAVVKVGDTVADMEEASNAGIWSVGITESSSLISKSEADLMSLSERERSSLIRQAGAQLSEAGAHFVIGNLSELPAVLEQINTRLEKGQIPPRLTHLRGSLAN